MENNVASVEPAVISGPSLKATALARHGGDIITRVKSLVKDYMSQPQFDASHDYTHILRVLTLAEHILSVEQRTNPSVTYDATTVKLAALLHDVGDHKYQVAATGTVKGDDPNTMAKSVMLRCGAPLAQAICLQTIVTNVSYSHEIRNPDQVQRALLLHPELAVIQDADRIDSLGAIGIGRTFTYGGAKGRTGVGMEGTLQHFEGKLLRLQRMMKTAEGRRLAKDRTERLVVFREWWMEENAAAGSQIMQ